MSPPSKLERRLVLALAAACLACAPAGREGESISVTDESAIIVWEAASKTQHFIRKADFRTTAKDFGFLVPTPTVPVLEEADNAAFTMLARLTAPETSWQMARGEMPKGIAMEAPKGEEVKLIAEKKVAGYDAAILEASNAEALGAWLGKHGYHSSPQLVEWFKPYIEKKWKITAFKISSDSGRDGAKASAVRMSFSTDRPFFPYREPPAGPTKAEGYFPERILRVYFISDARYDGKIGAAAKWPGDTVWSGVLDGKARTDLFKLLKFAAPSASALRLTEFEDRSDPRPGTDDLYFGAAASQADVRRPAIVRLFSVSDVIMLLVFAGILGGLLYGLWKALAALFLFLRRT